MFKVGHIYTHKNMLDVCMFVIKVESTRVGVNLGVRWFKRNGLDLNAKDDVYINEWDVKDWYEYAGEN